MKKIIVFICLLFCFRSGFSQKHGQAYIDSLLLELPKQKEDSNKVKLLCNLANRYRLIDSPEVMKYARMAKDLAERLKWERGIYRSEIYLGLAYKRRGNYPEAQKLYLASLAGWQKLDDKAGISDAYDYLLYMYKTQGNNPKALEYGVKTLKMKEVAGDKMGVGIIAETISEIYLSLNDGPKALEYLLKAIKIFEEPGNSYPEAELVCLENAAVIYQRQNEYAKALEYSAKTTLLAEKQRDTSVVANMKGNMALVYTSQKNYPLAIEYGHKSLEMSASLKDSNLVATAMYEIGNALLLMVSDTGKPGNAVNTTNKIPEGSDFMPKDRTAQLHLALEYLRQAVGLKEQVTDPSIVQSIYGDLAKAYKLNDDYKMALQSYQIYEALKDSISSKEISKKMVQVQMQNDFDAKESAAKAEQEKKDTVVRIQRYSFIGGGVLLLLLLGGAVNRYRFENRAKKTIASEKQRSDELLLNILPAETAEELKKYGKASAKGYDEVTVLFADIKGFTIISETLGPDVLVKELDNYFQAFDNVIGAYGLEKIKTIGDAYLCVGGLPVADVSAPEKVISAAMEMLKYLEKVKAEKLPLNQSYFEIRIGIHTGPCVAGVVGVKKFAYDIWGDTVNTAARMEQNSEPGKINISETTYQLVKDKFKCTYRGLIEAKNKGEIKMYFVEGEI